MKMKVDRGITSCDADSHHVEMSLHDKHVRTGFLAPTSRGREETKIAPSTAVVGRLNRRAPGHCSAAPAESWQLNNDSDSAYHKRFFWPSLALSTASYGLAHLQRTPELGAASHRAGSGTGTAPTRLAGCMWLAATSRSASKPYHCSTAHSL